MGAEQYKGLLFLTLGASAFLILYFVLRLSAGRTRRRGGANDAPRANWVHPERLVVVQILEEGRNIRSFRLRRQSSLPFPSFRAGQFITVQIGDDSRLTRSYSICSSAENRSVLTIGVRKLEGGVGSTWMHSLKTGDQLVAYPPSGHFSDGEIKDGTVVYVAGGIGITPILSMVHTNLDRANPVEMHLFYGVRTVQDLAYHSILTLLSQRHKNFHYHVIFSEDSGGEGHKGMLTFDFVKSQMDLKSKPPFFICGPAPMMDKMTQALLQEKWSEDHIHVEQFISPVDLSGRQELEHPVRIRYAGREMIYRGKQTLLEFFESQGIDFPYACRAGVCGSCKCQIKGSLDQLTSSGLTLRERQDGFILTCVSFPLGDLEVLSAPQVGGAQKVS